MIEDGGIPGLERYLADMSFCTARSAPEYAAIFELDIEPGMAVLDVGAGGSDFTARLIDSGVDAYAVDPIYRARSQVRGKVKDYSKLLLDNALTPEARRKLIRRATLAQETVERFSESVKENPDRYVPGFALSLPFPDETFDRVFSNNCVTEWMDTHDPMLLIGAVGQMIRVTKPGGKIQLYPFGKLSSLPKDMKSLNSPEDIKLGEALRRANHQALISLLMATHISHRVFQGDGESETLVIEKPVLESVPVEGVVFSTA